MNVNSGGPHLLLFERDQQLTALLSSEFQLAGYECHAARTAVEVFDAIARYPVRLVLVNLAQAAAGRREFWVALDAQRRGRGVQVFTFRCMNLAGYGPDDPDERGRTVLADMEVDGMLGVMNLVDAVRTRIPGSTTGSNPRLSAAPAASRQAGMREASSMGAKEVKDTPQGDAMHRVPAVQAGATPSSMIAGQVTSPLPLLTNNGTAVPSSQPVSSPALPGSQPSVPGSPIPQTGMPRSSMPVLPTVAPSAPLPVAPGNTPSSFTDKIRAVIYPSSRNFSQIPAGQETAGDLAGGTDKPTPYGVSQVNGQNLQNQPVPNASAESGLEQLSRMLREQAPAMRENEAQQNVEARLIVPPPPSAMRETLSGDQGTQRPAESPSISAMSLRASPIQDIAIERGSEGLASREASRRIAGQEAKPSVGAVSAVSFNPSPPSDASPSTHPTAFAPPSTPPLPPPPVLAPPPPPTVGSTIDSSMVVGLRNSVAPSAPKPASTSMPIPQPAHTSVPAPASASIKPENEEVVVAPLADAQKSEPSLPFTEDKPGKAVATPTDATIGPDVPRPGSIDRLEESSTARTLVEQVVAATASPGGVQGMIRRNESGTDASTDETLLNIVQSFPPMPSPAQAPQQAQPPVLSGRATRSLGSVLLEGHLVPQHRLEVAQQIQRMLRGVDMNYQLGEILLMFKLLTPDQLLAASLVSYGLISTTQISALGRIRQELHSIGLEYDLESLLVVFRILSPEQLREVRASWSA